MNETQRNINRYRAALPGLRERIAATAMLLAVSLTMVVSASFAWYTISASPEVSTINTTITGNGNLEIALAGRYDEYDNIVEPDVSKVGDSYAAPNKDKDLVSSNITWGNLINLADSSYGLGNISLRPALLSRSALDKSPLYGATYASDGRVVDISETYKYATFGIRADGTPYFDASKGMRYGVRAIASVKTVGNAEEQAVANSIWKEYIKYSSAAREGYVNIITGTTEVAPNRSCIAVLSDLMEKYVADEVHEFTGNGSPSDYSSLVTYTYRVIQELEKVIENEGLGLMYLANYQAYMDDISRGSDTFETVDELLAALDDGTLGDYIRLVSIKPSLVSATEVASFQKSRGDIRTALSGLKALAEECNPDDDVPDRKVLWAEIKDDVNYLVDIETCSLNNIEMKNLTASLGSLLNLVQTNSEQNKATVVMKKGALRDTEKRMGSLLADYKVSTSIHIKANYMGYNIDKDAYAYITTSAKEPYLAAVDDNYSNRLELKIEGDQSTISVLAKDTYGMAIDMWVRTNAEDTTLLLEGNVITTDEPMMGINQNGEETEIYMVGRSAEETEVYQIEDADGVINWYKKSDGSLFGTDSELASLGYTFEKKEGAQVDGRDIYAASVPTAPVDGYKLEEERNTWYDAKTHEVLGTDETLKEYGATATRLEGQTCTDADGNTVDLYEISNQDGSLQVYKTAEKSVNWYNASNHLLIGENTALMNSGYYFIQRTEAIVVGYNGENRIWSDWVRQMEDGYIHEDSTTQGAGSCYVFYASPSDQNRILKLLDSFSITFSDQEGNELATARLNTNYHYAINGKVTVPLEITKTNATYIDDKGEKRNGILLLNQNEATWITAIVYLDGSKLTNEQVLAAGSLEGRLNLQFGSSVDLNGANDSYLKKEYRTITATATATDKTGETKTVSSAEPFIQLPDYDGTPKQVTVTLNVAGDQPKNISGFFTRAVGATSGTRSDTETFTDNGDGTWTAVFEITKPGTYAFRTVVADGSEYVLEEAPTVRMDGLGFSNLYCSYSSGEIMTADEFVKVGVSVDIAAEGELMPKSVLAVFKSAEDGGKDYSATLLYDGNSWSGSAQINTSGTYVLRYLIIDGEEEELAAEQRTTLVITLGLTVRVWCADLSVIPESFKNEFTIPMQVKIYNDSDKELTRLENVWLTYHSAGSTLDSAGMRGEVKWSSNGYYEGNLLMKNAGIYYFDRVTITSVKDGVERNNNINKSPNAPTFSVMYADPPAFAGNETDTYQVLPDGGARMGVKLENASAAYMWALVCNEDTGERRMVECPVQTPAGQASYRDGDIFYFDVPANGISYANAGKQDGNWKIEKLCFQNVYSNNKPINVTLDANGESVDPTLENYASTCYVIDTSSRNIKTKVVQTVKLTAKAGDADYTGEIFGLDADGNVVNSMLQSNTSKSVVFSLVDWQNEPITEGIESISWNINYDLNPKAIPEGSEISYGGYSFTDASNRPAAMKQVLIEDDDDGSVDGRYVAGGQEFVYAGTYSSNVAVKYGEGKNLVFSDTDKLGSGQTNAGDLDIYYTVWSGKPDVKITGLNPTGTKEVYESVSAAGGATNAYNMIDAELYYTDYYARAYIHSGEGGLGQGSFKVGLPKVKLTLSGMRSSGFTAEMFFKSNAPYHDGTTNHDGHTYSFTKNNHQVEQTIGYGVDGIYVGGLGSLVGQDSEKHPAVYPIGKQTLSQITVTYEGFPILADLKNAVTIDQPNVPPFATFAAKSTSGVELNSVPDRMIPSRNAEGKLVITLPGSSTWTVDRNVPISVGEYELKSNTNRTVYGTWKEGGFLGIGATKYYKVYTENTKVSVATTVAEVWTDTHTITGWKIGNTVYDPGATVEINGKQTVTAVLETPKPEKETVDSTRTKTEITYTLVSEKTKTKPNPGTDLGFGNGNPPANSVTYDPPL